MIYEKMLAPWLVKNERTIDFAIDYVQGIYRAKTKDFARWAQTKALSYMNERPGAAPKRPAARPKKEN